MALEAAFDATMCRICAAAAEAGIALKAVDDQAKTSGKSWLNWSNEADEFGVAKRSESSEQHQRQGGREMPEWEKKIGAINLIVGDLERSKAFYREVFRLPVQHEDEDTAMFRFEETYVFLQRGTAHQDGPSGDVLSLGQKGIGQFVMFVEDVDAVRAELDQGEVAILSGPADRDWGMRTLTFADPGGYTWEITQELPRSS